MRSVSKPISDINLNETVVFYPTFGHLADGGRVWHVPVRGCVFEPAPHTIRREIVIRLMRRFLKVGDGPLETEIFNERVGSFLATHERGKRIVVRVGSRIHVLQQRSKRNGHFRGTLRLPVEELHQLQRSGQLDDGWLSFHAVTRARDARVFTGRAEFIAETGASVISDIDDTIKHSEVMRRRTLLTNTFLREFQPVPGMGELYRAWAAEGCAFHYVSSSPWQLYGALEQLRRSEAFPDGTFHLRALRLKDPTVLRLFLDRRRGKRKAIRTILRTFPYRRFVLVGDSGERDPEIYGSIARKRPHQVARILIRDLGGPTSHSQRWHKAFRRLPPTTWQTFHDPGELAGGLLDVESSARDPVRSV